MIDLLTNDIILLQAVERDYFFLIEQEITNYLTLFPHCSWDMMHERNTTITTAYRTSIPYFATLLTLRALYLLAYVAYGDNAQFTFDFV